MNVGDIYCVNFFFVVVHSSCLTPQAVPNMKTSLSHLKKMNHSFALLCMDINNENCEYK